MKKYLKPTVIIHDDLSEGIYADSGASSDCWGIRVTSQQDWNGDSHVFSVHGDHQAGSDDGHQSSSITVTISFNHTLTAASSDAGSCQFSGNTLTIVRDGRVNKNQNINFKVSVRSVDESTTRALAVTGSAIICTKS